MNGPVACRIDSTHTCYYQDSLDNAHRALRIPNVLLFLFARFLFFIRFCVKYRRPEIMSDVALALAVAGAEEAAWPKRQERVPGRHKPERKFMSFKNIFEGGKGEAGSAEESAQNVYEKIPGARPEREGVDPELFDGIPDAERDPKIIRETSPEALSIMSTFLAPLFKNTQTAATAQQEASEDPQTTSDMASSAADETFAKVEVEIDDEDQPNISEEEREKLKQDNQQD